MRLTLHAAFLYCVNIPGGVWLTGEEVEGALARLAPAVTFAGIVGRPDSLLLWSSELATEDSLCRAVTEAVDRPCVVLSMTRLERITEAALDVLRGAGQTCAPPYRVTSDGVDCEWCLVLASDALPPGAVGHAWLFGPNMNAVAVTVLERRALLARKRRFNARGKRVTLSAVLNDP